jgi:hypothetical protein
MTSRSLRRPVLVLLAALLAAAPGVRPAGAQDAPPKDGGGLDDAPPKPLTPAEEKAALDLFSRARAFVEKGHGIAARKLFEEFLEKYPGYPDEELIREADDRCGPNFLAGIELQHDAGPSARRLDVELMGDGYTLENFRKFEGEALSQMVEFWKEPLYREYEDYINVWRFDLVSKEEGVDDIMPEERGEAPPTDPKKLKKYEKLMKKLKRYSTALDCKAAGPQRQVMANREQVMRWRRYLKESDGLTIAFARKGELGMGGGGIATTGRKVAVVHEFGHAFVGLRDEYSGNPNRPMERIFEYNAVSTSDPDPRVPPPTDEIPWKHWLLLKRRPTDVGVFLGGATYSTGVFKPATGCAMNAGGNSAMCTVCREQGVLRIYSFVNPVDEYGPLEESLRLAQGETRDLFVQPMKPKTHDLQVEWKIQVLATNPDAAPADAAAPMESVSVAQDERAAGMWRVEGTRAEDRRANPLPEGGPKGAPLKPTVKKVAGGALRSTVKIEKLPPGVYRVTARVFDDTKLPGQEFPWVIKDPERLREEWRSWTVVSQAPAAAAPATPPANPPK